jgi:hypothetical protein
MGPADGKTNRDTSRAGLSKP